MALHEAVAAKLEAHPELLDVARQNLERWLQKNPATAVREWRRILDSTPLPEVVALLRSSSQEATRLRQSSPFAGLLTTKERRTIMGAYESRRP
jgi:CBS-domain-containing membrane protein